MKRKSMCIYVLLQAKEKVPKKKKTKTTQHTMLQRVVWIMNGKNWR